MLLTVLFSIANSPLQYRLKMAPYNSAALYVGTSLLKFVVVVTYNRLLSYTVLYQASRRSRSEFGTVLR